MPPPGMYTDLGRIGHLRGYPLLLEVLLELDDPRLELFLFLVLPESSCREAFKHTWRILIFSDPDVLRLIGVSMYFLLRA